MHTRSKADNVLDVLDARLEPAFETADQRIRIAAPNGELGYFSKRFDVYDREGEPCHRCLGTVRRIVQGGRSTFFCSACQH